MKKQLTFKQRLALQANKATTLEKGVCFPYGFEAYAKVAAACTGKKLANHWG